MRDFLQATPFRPGAILQPNQSGHDLGRSHRFALAENVLHIGEEEHLGVASGLCAVASGERYRRPARGLRPLSASCVAAARRATPPCP